MLSTAELSDYLHPRHNGIIIEAIETETATEGDENSSSRSRSGTPSSRNNENPNGVPVQTHQDVPTPAGSSSYYRQHTALINRKFPFSLSRLQFLSPDPAYVLPRIQHKTQHYQLVHPTSSARTASPWPAYSHWPSGVPPPPHMSAISYIHPPLCYPSPHYRPHTTAYPSSPSPSDSSQQPNGAGPRTPNSTDLSRNSPTHSSHDSSSISCAVDPELDSYAELTAEDVVAAMRVVMSMQVKSAEHTQDHETNQNSHDFTTTSRSLDGDHLNNRDLEDRLNGLHDYSPSLDRPEPMEHVLTEDGEPMLNPGVSLYSSFPILLLLIALNDLTAELLTQVSWCPFRLDILALNVQQEFLVSLPSS